MKETDLRQHADCSLCKRPIGHTGLPLFWTLTIERWGIDLRAVRRQDGLAAFLGGHSGLAAVMGPDDDLAQPVMEPIKLTLCESCALERSEPVMVLAEASRE